MKHVKPKADPAKTLAIILVGACLMVAIDFFVLDGKDYIARLWPTKTQPKQLSPQDVKNLKQTHSHYMNRGLEEHRDKDAQEQMSSVTPINVINDKEKIHKDTKALPYEEFYAVPVITPTSSQKKEEKIISEYNDITPAAPPQTLEKDVVGETQDPYFKTEIKTFEDIRVETEPEIQPTKLSKEQAVVSNNFSKDTPKKPVKNTKAPLQIKDIQKTLEQKPITTKRYTPPPPTKKGVVVIIIDDMGLSARSYNVAKLPGPLTLAYLPYADNLPTQTKYAKQRGHELMVHMPMQPMNDAVDGGPTLLRTDQSEEKFKQLLKYNLTQFDGYVGVNNHMGSKLTQSSVAMRIVMEELKKRNLFFVDSKTIGSSVAADIAKNTGIPFAVRDVFLDHHITPEFIQSALVQVEKIAKRKGYAIAIGHPHVETIKALEEWLPTLEKKGLTLKPVSHVLNQPIKNEPLLSHVSAHENAVEPSANVIKNNTKQSAVVQSADVQSADIQSTDVLKSKVKESQVEQTEKRVKTTIQNQKIVVTRDGITIIPKTSEQLAQPHE